ncbi:MAG: sigma factor-like helix-turn-helix DNA-binding protein [Solirubrobacteraceae bacterium]
MASADAKAPSAEDLAERHLRGVIAARRRHDKAAMMKAWEAFLLVELARVRGRVGARGIPEVDLDIVTGDVFERVFKTELRGSTIGEARSLVNMHTDWAILDYKRRVGTDEHRTGVALNADGDRDAALVAGAELELDLRSLPDTERAHLRDALRQAMDSVDQNKRDVVRLRLLGYDGDEVARRLDLSRANVDQLFRRGRLQLKSALESLL